MGLNSFGYNVVLLLHIVCVIVGFGGVILNGVYAAKAQQLPPEQNLAVMEVNSFVSMKVAEVFIYLVPVWGLGLVGMSDTTYTFGQTWVWLSLVVYVLSLGVSHGALMPRVKRMLETQRDMVASPPSGPEDARIATLQAGGKQVGAMSMVLNLSLVVMIVLMIWKPGYAA